MGADVPAEPARGPARRGARRASSPWLGTLAFVVLVGSTASAQPGAPPRGRPVVAVHVTAVRGPVPRRAIMAVLRRAHLVECQHTHIGGPVRFELRVSAAGTARVDAARGNYATQSYARCVRQRVERSTFPRRDAETAARVTIVFPSQGIGPRGEWHP